MIPIPSKNQNNLYPQGTLLHRNIIKHHLSSLQFNSKTLAVDLLDVFPPPLRSQFSLVSKNQVRAPDIASNAASNQSMLPIGASPVVRTHTHNHQQQPELLPPSTSPPFFYFDDKPTQPPPDHHHSQLKKPTIATGPSKFCSTEKKGSREPPTSLLFPSVFESQANPSLYPSSSIEFQTPSFSPSRVILVDMAKEEWGVGGYGSMKGLIRLRSPEMTKRMKKVGQVKAMWRNIWSFPASHRLRRRLPLPASGSVALSLTSSPPPRILPFADSWSTSMQFLLALASTPEAKIDIAAFPPLFAAVNQLLATAGDRRSPQPWCCSFEPTIKGPE
ncbi:unnamed protein product [Lactuca virosa]|uniref:Uncharacterized protein n=1 Tax=Lactuca virosa TaxID=75947 RepID=A0AAU9PE30_9ASTR|nr:unnamed protein product [Lactuca virosa]